MADQHQDTCATSFKPIGERVEKICQICGTHFWVHPSKADVRTNCGRKCQYNATIKRLKGKFGKDASYFKGGYHYNKQGYKQVLISGPKEVTGMKRYKAEHVLKAEKVLGRELKKGECVHHIDCNPMNNSNDNLLICERGYHSWLHWEMGKRYGQEVLAKGVA